MSEAAATLPARQVYVPPEINPWFIALTVTLATFMEVLDTSIANVSLPHIAGGLGAGVDESTWILTSYLVSNAIVLPMSGWFSSLIGRKRFYMSCVAVFTISSFLAGKTRHGFCGVWHGRGSRACNRSHSGRIHYRQL
jgi:DHA2 family multidrug resistance protein